MSPGIEEHRLTNASAALRHVRDAEHLSHQDSPHRSLDQAFHLAGFGPECARKAALVDRSLFKLLGHRLTGDTDPVLAFVLATDPKARRYLPSDWESRFHSLTSWSESVRYEKTGTRGEQEVTALVGECRRLVDEIIMTLCFDGVLPWRLP